MQSAVPPCVSYVDSAGEPCQEKTPENISVANSSGFTSSASSVGVEEVGVTADEKGLPEQLEFEGFVPWPNGAVTSGDFKVWSEKGNSERQGRSLKRQAARLKQITSGFLLKSATAVAGNGGTRSGSPGSHQSLPGSEGAGSLVGEEALLIDIPPERHPGCLFPQGEQFPGRLMMSCWLDRGSNADAGHFNLLDHRAPLRNLENPEFGEHCHSGVCTAASNACPYVPSFAAVYEELAALIPRPREVTRIIDACDESKISGRDSPQTAEQTLLLNQNITANSELARDRSSWISDVSDQKDLPDTRDLHLRGPEASSASQSKLKNLGGAHVHLGPNPVDEDDRQVPWDPSPYASSAAAGADPSEEDTSTSTVRRCEEEADASAETTAAPEWGAVSVDVSKFSRQQKPNSSSVSRQVSGLSTEEYAESEERQMRLRLADFPEWLMQVDPDPDSDSANPYKAVRLRKTGLRPYQESGAADAAATHRLRSQLAWMQNRGGRLAPRSPGTVSGVRTPETGFNSRNGGGPLLSDQEGRRTTDAASSALMSERSILSDDEAARSVAVLRARFEKNHQSSFREEVSRDFLNSK